jgi:Protein of unknown function (DUF1553)/Protein of unknown function (DUF1549)
LSPLAIAVCMAGPLCGAEPARTVTFEFDVQPLLTRFGCNAGACHGKSRGQNGFALSLLGFDSDFDYRALVHERRGRRIFPAAVEQSLLLRKPTGQMPHGGGKKFEVGSPQYELLRAWLQAGAPRTPADAPRIVRVMTEPASRSLTPRESFQLRVLAEYSDGKRRDVTDGCAFQSNDSTLAAVTRDGMVKAGVLPGEAAIMARYMNNIAVCDVIMPLPGSVAPEAYQELARNNDIDDLAFRKNKPYDPFVRELVAAQGSTWRNGATVIFRDRPEPVEIGASVSHLFLGVRLECAKCHHHPFEVWSQDDFFGFAAFFARVGHKGGVSPPISGGEEIIFTAKTGKLLHGRTHAPVLPKTLTGKPIEISPQDDPREVLVEWMTESSNPYFARVMANRVWAELMGQGLVEPVDDIRATNPASNGPLLEALANDFRRQGYDIKKLIRKIATSQAFGLSSKPGDRK